MTLEQRRSFLKLSGFGLLAACSRGIETKAIPLLVPAEERIPGVSTWYSSLCDGCPAGCGVLARSRRRMYEPYCHDQQHSDSSQEVSFLLGP